MKTVNVEKKLVQSIIVLLIFSFSGSVVAQEKKETRAERKERQKQEQIKKFEIAKAAMYDTAFVVPAESIQFRGGRQMFVNKTINFLQLIGNEGVLQIGSTFSINPGLNNLGGVTLKGPVSNLKIQEKKDRIFMSFYITDVVGTAHVSLAINGSNSAYVDVDGMFSGRMFTMRGNLIDFKEAGIFEGTSR